MAFLFEGVIKVSALYLNDGKEDCSGNAGSVPRDTVTSVSTSSFTSKIAPGYPLNECFFQNISFCIEAAQFLKAASKREIRPAATQSKVLLCRHVCPTPPNKLLCLSVFYHTSSSCLHCLEHYNQCSQVSFPAIKRKTFLLKPRRT